MGAGGTDKKGTILFDSAADGGGADCGGNGGGARFSTAAQNELDRCLRHNRIPSGKVRMVVQARLPWTFGDESGYPEFGDSWCFHTNVRYSHTTGAYPTPVLQKVFALVKK